MHWNYLKRIFSAKYGGSWNKWCVLSICHLVVWFMMDVCIWWGTTYFFLQCIGRYWNCSCVEAFWASLFKCNRISYDLADAKQAGNAFWISKVAISFEQKNSDSHTFEKIRNMLKHQCKQKKLCDCLSNVRRNNCILFETHEHMNAAQHLAQSNK